MKLKNKIVKVMCCCSITIGARLIGFVGVAISAGLASILLRDTSSNNYDASRKTALVLGLDWQHFHPNANTTNEADPNGQMISAIVLFYSVLYIITSLSLIFATILKSRWLTVPWLICESLGCLSKVVALVFHGMYATKEYNKSFVIGSVIYIVIMTWWWLVVFAAQASWKKDKLIQALDVAFTTYFKGGSSILTPSPEILFTNEVLSMDSPAPYMPNEKYTFI